MTSFFEEMQNEDPVYIDRKQEDMDVLDYQKTKNPQLLYKLYTNRVPTLRNWTLKHYFPGLTPSIEDFFAEMRVVFVKSVKHYKPNFNGTPVSFNTCLFNFLLNRVKNIKSSRYAKKRIPEGYEGPVGSIELSLDYDYGDSNGHETSLMDQLETEDHDASEMMFSEAVNYLSGGNPILKDVFVSIGNGCTLSAAIRECKMRHGHIEVDKDTISRIERFGKRSAFKAIRDSGIEEDFTLHHYAFDGKFLVYSIEMNKTPESDMVMKTIRQFKKEKRKHLHEMGVI